MSMHDMTQGAVRGHVLRMMAFMLTGLVVQTLYSLIDIYWVSRLGEEAVAAVSLSSNVMFVVMAVSQMIGVGAVALVSQSAGRKEQQEVLRLFNQAQSLSVTAGCVFAVLGFAFMGAYARELAGSEETAALSVSFLSWFVPAMAMQFTMVGLASAMRGIGEMKPTLVAQLLSVLLNMLLAPFLIFGWLGLPRMGVVGAGLSTLLATVVAVAYLALYLARGSRFLKLNFAQWRPDGRLWLRMLGIGLPAGSELLLMALIMGVIYYVIRPFGADAQAGFGIGQRIMQAGFMPSVALSFAVAGVVGQNFGAGLIARVRESFYEAAKIALGFMVVFTLLCHFIPEMLMRVFTKEPAVIAPGAEYLRVISYNYLASGIAFVASGVFQGLGNTWPSLIASGSRLLTFVVPVLWMSNRPGFDLSWVWTISVVSVLLQAALSLFLLFRRFAAQTGPQPAVSGSAL